MRLMWMLTYVLLGFAVTGAVVLNHDIRDLMDRMDRLEARLQELEVE